MQVKGHDVSGTIYVYSICSHHSSHFSAMKFLYLFTFLCWATSLEVATQCPGVELVSRAEWGAKPRKGERENITEPVDYVIIHHTAGQECSNFDRCALIVRGIQNYHMNDRGWDDIGYSFLIGGNGQVFIGRDWGTVGAHTYHYNSVAYGISFLGTFIDHLPTEKAMDAAKKLIQCGVDQGFIKADYGLYGHRDAGCTECPGKKFYESLSSWDKWHAKGTIPKYCAQ